MQHQVAEAFFIVTFLEKVVVRLPLIFRARQKTFRQRR